MTPKMQAQLIAVYKHFAKHPKRVDAQLAFVRQVDKCLTDHGYELWTEAIVNQTGARLQRTKNDSKKRKLWWNPKSWKKR